MVRGGVRLWGGGIHGVWGRTRRKPPREGGALVPRGLPWSWRYRGSWRKEGGGVWGWRGRWGSWQGHSGRPGGASGLRERDVQVGIGSCLGRLYGCKGRVPDEGPGVECEANLKVLPWGAK